MAVFGAEISKYSGFKVYSFEDASMRQPASLFASVDYDEKHIQNVRNYASSVSVFLLEFDKGGARVLVDAGFGLPKGLLMKALADASIAPESITDILVTHIHPDHVGAILKFPKAKVHIARLEYEQWKKDASRQALKRFLPGEESLHLFEYDAEILPGLVSIKAAGHTPGHTFFRIQDTINGRYVYFVGDVVHAAALQMAHPNFCARYDMNPVEAAATRKHALKNYKGDWFGAHVPFPGKISRD